MTKWYINNQRSENKPLFFFELLNIIKGRIKTLILANNMAGRINKSWQDMLDDFMQLGQCANSVIIIMFLKKGLG